MEVEKEWEVCKVLNGEKEKGKGNRREKEKKGKEESKEKVSRWDEEKRKGGGREIFCTCTLANFYFTSE